jgi:hypothetical protein
MAVTCPVCAAAAVAAATIATATNVDLKEK